MKIHTIGYDKGAFPEYIFWCPGCKHAHGFKTSGHGAVWTFNGDMEKPTVSPSILTNGNYHLINPDAPRCHLFLRDGNLEFLSDCSHDLAGQTVPLEDF